MEHNVAVDGSTQRIQPSELSAVAEKDKPFELETDEKTTLLNPALTPPEPEDSVTLKPFDNDKPLHP